MTIGRTRKPRISWAPVWPRRTREAAILITLAPGNCTALLSDAEGAIGVGLLEIYNITNSQTRIQR